MKPEPLATEVERTKDLLIDSYRELIVQKDAEIASLRQQLAQIVEAVTKDA